MKGDSAPGSCAIHDGGSGGGCSAKFAEPAYQSSTHFCASGKRSVPDIALNASGNSAQNIYFDGGLHGVAGTSVAAPMVAGFVAQANAYLLAIGLGGAPVGALNYKLYWAGMHTSSSYKAHYPFYDVISGCNRNDNTSNWDLDPYCAGTGYDAVTGWGSFNALQLSWAINAYYLGDFAAPKVAFSGPAISKSSLTWFTTDQAVSWKITDTVVGGRKSTGVAGFSQGWDKSFDDAVSEASPGSGNSFYTGPQFPNATSGSMKLSAAGQGCHYATVNAWDNSGISSGDQYDYWICYDTVTPVGNATVSPAPNSNGYEKQTVKVTLTGTDPGNRPSGVFKTYFAVNSTSCTPAHLVGCGVYASPLLVGSAGMNYVTYFVKDVAGNISTPAFYYLYIDKIAPVSKATLSGVTIAGVYSGAVKVSFLATDNYSGIALTRISVDGGAMSTYSGQFSVSATGNHTIQYYSLDHAGNAELKQSLVFTIKMPIGKLVSRSRHGGPAGLVITAGS